MSLTSFHKKCIQDGINTKTREQILHNIWKSHLNAILFGSARAEKQLHLDKPRGCTCSTHVIEALCHYALQYHSYTREKFTLTFVTGTTDTDELC